MTHPNCHFTETLQGSFTQRVSKVVYTDNMVSMQFTGNHANASLVGILFFQ
jgi:hypothetical protein